MGPKKTWSTVCLSVALLTFVISPQGCAPGGDAEEAKKAQSEILARLGKIEENQKKIIEKMDKLPPGKQRPQVDYNKVYDIKPGESPFRGPQNAKVVITEFSDFQCPYCARFQPIIKKIIDTYPNDVKHVFKNYPLSFHKDAKNAARAALAAGEQGKYWEMNKTLFENFRNLKEDKLKEYAQKIGLDMEKFNKSYESPFETELKADKGEAAKAEVRGTPTIFLNGKRVKDRSVEGLKKQIDEILKKGG